MRPSAGHALGQQAAAAPHIQRPLAGQGCPLVNVVQAQRIDIVQRFELAGRVPPAAGERLEFGDFVPVYVLVCHIGSAW